jgi:hypothetical protein
MQHRRPVSLTSLVASMLLLGGGIFSPAIPGSLELGGSHTGLGLGNCTQWNGLRLNLADTGVDRIRGLNLTVGPPGPSPEGHVLGLSLSLVGTRLESQGGVMLGGLYHLGRHAHGIVLCPGAVLLGPPLRGDDAAIASLPRGSANGIMAAMAIGGGHLRGIGVTGLCSVAESMDGVFMSAWGLLPARQLRGIAVAPGIGLSPATPIIPDFPAGEPERLGTIRGLGVGAVVLTRQFDGIALGAMMLESQRLTGFGLGGLGFSVDVLRGVGAGLFSEVRQVQMGLSLGAVNSSRKVRGVCIGLVNHTPDLRGIQIGLVNHAANATFRTLPFVNARF